MLSSSACPEEALAATEEAVGVYRTLARGNPAHQPGLAVALDGLGTRLAGLGRPQEALTVTEEAVGVYRTLARDNPAYQPDLARALANLENRLAVLGLSEGSAGTVN